MATLIYARVSKYDQNLSHQEESLWSYVTDDLGVDEGSIDVLSDKSTETDRDRSGYREMLRRIRAGGADRVVVREVT